jgi:hypothetical protein
MTGVREVEPFFLLGAERDGLLLLQLMLGAHSELAWRGDFDFALAWPPNAAGEGPAVMSYWWQLALSPRVKELGLRIDPTLAFPELVRSMLEQQCGDSRRQPGVAISENYDRALRLWPRARFLCLSSGVARNESERLRLRESALAWRRIAAEILPERRLELRYEALVSDVGAELARVCEFLGVRFDSELLRIPVDTSHSSAARAGRRLPCSSPAPSRFARGLGERFARLLGG